MGTVIAASAAPYGYTITIWSSGAVLMRSHGSPSVGEVFLFLSGALIAFGTLGLLFQGALSERRSIDRRADRVIAGSLDWLGVGAAVGAVALLAGIGGPVAWLISSFAATVIYLVGAAVQLTVAAWRHQGLDQA